MPLSATTFWYLMPLFTTTIWQSMPFYTMTILFFNKTMWFLLSKSKAMCV